MFPKHKSKGMRPLTGEKLDDQGWGAVNSSRSENLTYVMTRNNASKLK